MKSRIPHALAALLIAGAAPFAYSQAPAPAAADPHAVASVSKSDPVADAIAQALNGDAELKETKITVQPVEEGNILLTGSTTTELQRVRATKIAAQHAGDATVINVIVPDEFVLWVPPTGLAALEEPAATEEPAAGTAQS